MHAALPQTRAPAPPDGAAGRREHRLAAARAPRGRVGSCGAGAAAPQPSERAAALGKGWKKGSGLGFARGLAAERKPWRPQVDDLVVAMDEALRPAAVAAAVRLRGAGRSVDLLLAPRKMKAVFKARLPGRPCRAALLLAAGAPAAMPASSAWPASPACLRLPPGVRLLRSFRDWSDREGAAQGLHEPQVLWPSCGGPHGAAPRQPQGQGTDARRPAAGSTRSAAARRAWCCSRRPSGRRARCASRTWPRMRRRTCPSPTWSEAAPTWSEAAPPSLSHMFY